MAPSWTNTPFGTMRAVVLTTPGAQPPSSCFRLNKAYPKPTLPTPDWVLVRIRAAGINRTELRQRNNEPANPVSFGMFQNEFHNNKPAVLGEELVGEVDTPGTSTEFKAGDRVMCVYSGIGKVYDGAYAEFAIVHKEVCWRLPGPDEVTIGNAGGQVSWEALASFPGCGWTAWGSLLQAGSTKPGDTVVIRGATSAVGIWAILFAKARGCCVIATTRQERKIAKLKSVGADRVTIERPTGDGKSNLDSMVADILAFKPDGANTVLDLVDPASFLAFGFKIAAKYGTVVPAGVLGGGFAPISFSSAMIPSTRKLSTHAGFAVKNGLDAFIKECVFGLRDGTYKTNDILDMVLPLEEVGKAHDLLSSNELCGKVVLTVS